MAIGECVVATVYCVVCVIEYGWYVGRGDCGVCGCKDRCRDGNLRTYCHVSPILFGFFFCGNHPYYIFLHFCEMLFLELVSGDFLGEGFFFWILYLHVVWISFIFTCKLFPLFLGGKRNHLMFC